MSGLKLNTEECVWENSVDYRWQITGCGEKWFTDGLTPTQLNMKFCFSCGKKIKFNNKGKTSHGNSS